MMNPDERKLLKAVQDRQKGKDPFVIDGSVALYNVYTQLGISYDKAREIVHQWKDKGWWDFYHNWRMGWLTAEGRKVPVWRYGNNNAHKKA